jgi:hypothetical protein
MEASMKALINRKSLAERWDYDSTKPIIEMENEGIIKRVPGLPSPRYSLEEIIKIENAGNYNPLSPIERKRLERENQKLNEELEIFKEKFNKLKIVLGV